MYFLPREYVSFLSHDHVLFVLFFGLVYVVLPPWMLPGHDWVGVVVLRLTEGEHQDGGGVRHAGRDDGRVPGVQRPL